jgi:shikimate dehydrogenase
VARAIVYGLIKEQSQVTIYNRTASKGEKLAHDFSARFGGGLAELSSIEDYDIVVNATSVGFHAPDESVIPPAILREAKVVLDVVFIPPQSKLIRDAKARGCVAISGIRMLVHQARYQFELYTGKQAPFEVMEKALLHRVSHLDKQRAA